MPPSWGSTRAYEDRRANGILSAFVFNLCLLVAPVAAAIAFMIIARDGLYEYDASSAGGRAIAARVERLNGELIQLDFDRQRQWDDLVAMELMAEDVHAARGFLLSVRGMLPARATSQLRLARDAADADIERAALSLLTPGTRARYEAIVPLLSRRAATAAVDPGRSAAPPADPRDFELMARALLQEPETNTLQFVLTGLRLGLAGPLPDRAAKGAAALLEASRRDDYSLGLETDMADLISAVAPVDAFQAAATQSRGDPGAFDNAAAAFRASLDQRALRRALGALDQIGVMSEAASHEGAVALLTHAAGLGDLPKLRVVAQAAGDRAAAAAKRLQRDGRLLAAARGQLTMTRDLAAAIAAAVLAMFGLLAIVGLEAYRAARDFLGRWREEEEYDDLIEIRTESWRG